MQSIIHNPLFHIGGNPIDNNPYFLKMETSDHSKNGATPKSQTSRKLKFIEVKNFRPFFLFALLFFIGFKILCAQNTQPTPYQKKQLELSKKYFEIFYGYRMTMADEAFYEQLTKGKEAQEFLLALGILGYTTKHSEEQCKKVFAQMANEYKHAEKLKNATDFRLEKEAKALKAKREKERQLRIEQEAYARTDVSNIQVNIKSEFDKWNQKGEFEKEADYAERLKLQSQIAFEEICIKQIKDRINYYSDGYSLKKELSNYDSENEFFVITFKINGVEWQNKINIPISQAQVFKTNWSDLYFKIDDYDWCFVENSLCPTVVILEFRTNNSEYKFLLPIKNRSDILFSFDDLEINNPYLTGYVFKYSNAKAIVEKAKKAKQQLDSLELAPYNQRLDTIFQNYNLQLLQNPYNIDKKVMKSFDKIETNLKADYYGTLTEVRQRKFNEYKSNIEKKFKDLNNNFDRELKLSNPIEYSRIYFTQNPEKKNEADKKYLECRCDYPKRENFDLKFITGGLYDCNCRELEYHKNEKLFASKEEFDIFFDKGDEVLQKEVSDRTLKKEEDYILNYFHSQSRGIEKLDFKDALKDEPVNIFVINIKNCQNKPYYTQVLDFVIETNKGLDKEWTKNGQFFENKMSFYNAYISDYKKILNELKNK